MAASWYVIFIFFFLIFCLMGVFFLLLITLLCDPWQLPGSLCSCFSWCLYNKLNRKKRKKKIVLICLVRGKETNVSHGFSFEREREIIVSCIYGNARLSSQSCFQSFPSPDLVKIPRKSKKKTTR